MDNFIERLNIAHYLEQLKTVTDPIKREMLQQLLVEEKAKQVSQSPQMRQHSSVRQRFRYFSVIAMFLIVTVGLCWGLAHI
jgi:site-specific recombinase XerD